MRPRRTASPSGRKEHGAKVIAVTDTPISAVGQIADIVLLAASCRHRHAELAGRADGGGQCAAQRRRWRRAAPARVDRYSQHDAAVNRWDAFLLKLDGAD